MPPERPVSAHLKYRADIDGLRAVAVLSVIGFHAFPDRIRGGFIGVDIFFVISGFLISFIIFEGLERGDFRYGDFYARRIKRIFPALTLVLLASLCAGWLVLTKEEYGQLGKHVAAAAGFVSNFLLWQESGYFDNKVQTKPLLHLWSLGVEEQFYIIWPLLLRMAWKNKQNFMRVSVCIAIVSFIGNLYMAATNPIAAFYSPLSRFWELMLGGILAYLTLHKHPFLLRMRYWPSAAGFALIGLSIILLNKESEWPGWWALAPCIAACLIISAGPDAWLNRKLLGHPALVRIGLISYPLYLWHWPLLSFAYIMQSHVPSISLRIELVLISIMLAGATYEIFEKPIRFGNTSTIIIFVLCLYMAAIGYWGYYVSLQKGAGNIVFTSLFHASAKENYVAATDPYAPALKKYAQIIHSDPDYMGKIDADRYAARREHDCNWQPILHSFERYKETSEHCLVLSSTKKNVLIVGDSHAADLYMALTGTHKRLNFLQLTGNLCTPMSSIENNNRKWATECEKLPEYIMSFAKQNKLDAVIVGGWWHEDYGNLAPFLEALKAKKRKVILVGPPLEFSAEVYKIIARWGNDSSFQQYMDSSIVGSSLSLSAVIKDFARLNGVSYIDRIGYFCEKGCPVINSDGQLLIADYGHLSVFGAIFLGNTLLRENVLQKIMSSSTPLQLP